MKTRTGSDAKTVIIIIQPSDHHISILMRYDFHTIQVTLPTICINEYISECNAFGLLTCLTSMAFELIRKRETKMNSLWGI